MHRRFYTASTPRWSRGLLGLCALALCFAAPAVAQYPTTSSPTVPGGSTTSLIGIGSTSQISASGFRLTPSFRFQRGAVWMVGKQYVAGGFQSTFQFQISNPGGLI